MHGGVGLQRGQRQVAALGPKGHGVSDDVAHAEAGVELAVGDVTVLALRGGGRMSVEWTHFIDASIVFLHSDTGGDINCVGIFD